jgi:prepilin-type N-terminal cleavage/methylation domain-containing protein
MKPATNQRAMRGMTLLELVIAITIIGIAVSSVLAALSTQATRSAEAMISEQANGIASAYLNEILQKNFLNGPGNTRATFDGIGDYDSPAFKPVLDQWGTPVPGLGQFQVQVRVVNGNLNGLSAANQVQLVNVTVTHPSGVSILLSGYRTN